MYRNHFFEVNVGKADKIIRLVLVVCCIVMGFYFQSYWFLLGVLPLFSVLTGRCPMYSLLGVRTCPLKKTE